MTDIEQLVRDALGDDARLLPVPTAAAATARRAVGRRRAATVASAVVAVVGVSFAALLLPHPSSGDPVRPAAQPLEQSVDRDGLRLTIRLDDAAPAVGQAVSGDLTLTNTRSEAVGVIAGCGRQPSLMFNYSSMIAPAPAPPATPAGEFERQVLGQPPRPQTTVDRRHFFGFAPRNYSPPAPGGAGQCNDDGTVTPLAAGGTLTRHLAWTVQTPGAARADTDLPGQAVIAYVLPPAADGTPSEGDPTSNGSTTPAARDLVLRFALSLHGGHDDRTSLSAAVRAAITDSRFAAAVTAAPQDSWEFGWVLPTDKPGPGDNARQSVSFGQVDTDPAFGPVDTWYVVLVYRDGTAEHRVTATVDGHTGQVTGVTKRTATRP